MKAHYLQHVPFEGLGSIASWLEAAGYEITKTQFFKSATLPEPDEIDEPINDLMDNVLSFLKFR